MDRQALSAILDAHITGSRLDLPPGALQSDPVLQQLTLALGGDNLVLDPVTDRQQDAASDTVTGTGQNTIFRGMTVTARFTAGDPAGLSLGAQAAPGWTPDDSFTRLQYTLASALQFTDARWQLSSGAEGAPPAGLSFRGTMDTANSLGFFIFLIGDTDEVLAGGVEAVEEGVPRMRLAGGVRGGSDLSFLTLGPVSLALLTQALAPVRPGGTKQAAVRMEVSTSIDFVAQGTPRQIPLTGGIYSGSSSVRLDADTTQLVSAGLDELAALVNGVDLSGISFGEFQLESVVKLAGFTFTLDPLSSTQLTSALVTVESAQQWVLLSRGDGAPFLTLQSIRVSFGISAPFTADELSAVMRGELVLVTSRITVEASYSQQGVELQGYLEPSTPLSLREVAAYLLGETEPHTPELLFGEFSFLIQPGLSYQLAAEVTELWAVELGDVEFHLQSLTVDWEYAVGGQTLARLAGAVQLGGVDIGVLATYDAATGWDFTGALAPGQSVPIGDVLADIIYYFGIEPPAFLDSIRLDTLSVGFNPTSKNFDFALGGGLPVEDKWLEIFIGAAIRNVNNKFEMELTGSLTFGGMEFTLTFEKESAGYNFIAAYTHTGPPTIHLRDFVAEHLSTSVAEIIPEGLQVDLKDVLFGFTSTAADPQAAGGQTQGAAGAAPQSKFLFALDLSAAIILSDLPLVGQKFPSDVALGVNGLRLLVTSAALTRLEAESIDALMPAGMTRLTVPTAGTTQTTATTSGTTQTAAGAELVIERGLTVSALMNFAGSPQPLSLPVTSTGTDASTQTTGGTPTAPTAPPVTSSDNAKWFSLQKTFGPVYFEKVGVRYQDEAIWFLLSASLSVAGLTLSLDGLAVGSSVKSFDPKFDLRGLGLDYKGGGAVEIGGAFLRIPKEQSGKTDDEYDGAAIVKAEQLTLSAIGSYAELDGHPSLFVYAVLDYPLGGPSFFFVTGLAAGFGYNRALLIPPIEQVAQFPLVADAISGAAMPRDLGQKLASLQRYIPPSAGDYFLAVGIKFTSFKLIDSFALLTVSFGTQFEVNLLGLSTLIVPTPIPGQTAVTPLAEVQMAVRATFNPAQGFLGVSAQLTSASFILSRDCHLTGGFAFYSWFSGEHEGDFVLTLGGYHPEYSVPAHYPTVPRLGFNWRVDRKLSIKGNAYYALTAAALMAGGSLQATWDDGDLKAHFNAGADFIIYWQPYHYDAKISVDIGVTYTYNLFGRHTLKVDVGADLHIWGPEFTGKAHVKLSIISFDISFGSSPRKELQPIGWDAFRDSFLPKDKDGRLAICAVSVADGMVSAPQDEAGIDWVVNPKNFTLVTNSVIPSKAAFKGGAPIAVAGNETKFGIGSMAVASGNFSSSHTITIVRQREGGGEEADEPVEGDFEFRPVLKNVPVGLWGETLTPDMNGPGFVRETLAGFEVRPAAQPAPGVTADVACSALQYDGEDVPVVYSWGAHAPFVALDLDDEARRRVVEDSITTDATAAERARLLEALGVVADIELGGYDASAFLIAPQIEAVES